MRHFLAAALALLTPGLAAAGEADAPVIHHEQVATVGPGLGARLVARIESPKARQLLPPSAYVRLPGMPYVAMPMKAEADGSFAVEVPANLAGSGFEYYLEAWDEDGEVSRTGSATAPFRVAAATSAEPPLAVAPQTAKDADAARHSPRRRWSLVVGGVSIAALAGGLGCGVGTIATANAGDVPAAKTLATSANALYGVSAAAAVAAVVLYLVGGSDGSRSPPAGSPAPGDGDARAPPARPPSGEAMAVVF